MNTVNKVINKYSITYVIYLYLFVYFSIYNEIITISKMVNNNIIYLVIIVIYNDKQINLNSR